MVRVIEALALIGLASCGRPASEQTSPMPLIAGRWAVAGGRGALELTLTVRGTHAAGVGKLVDASGRATPVTIRGECTHPNFALDLLAHDHILGRYVGRYDPGGTLRGVLSDVDLPTDSLILVRLPDRALPPVVRPQWQ